MPHATNGSHIAHGRREGPAALEWKRSAIQLTRHNRAHEQHRERDPGDPFPGPRELRVHPFKPSPARRRTTGDEQEHIGREVADLEADDGVTGGNDEA